MDCKQFFEQIKGKKIAMCGIGVSNTPLILDFLKKGAKVYACDRRSREMIGEIADKLEAAGAELCLGDSYLNDLEVDTIKWVKKYNTSSHYIEKESRLCEISLDTVNANTLKNMANIHNQTLSSLEYIVSDYYGHIVTNHRIVLMTHTIEGFFRHTKDYNLLLQELKIKNTRKKKIDYIENVERVFRCFFYYHRKNNVQILNCIHLKNKQLFYKIIAENAYKFLNNNGKLYYNVEEHDLDMALRKFKQKVARDGVPSEWKKREAYDKPGVRRRAAKKEGIKNSRKRDRANRSRDY